MAGVKGRSGGPREGAGAKPKEAVYLDVAEGDCEDSLDFLRAVIRSNDAPLSERVRCAISLAQYEHTRNRDGGKNVAKTSRAEKAASGKFASGEAPRLAVDNTR